MSPSAAQVKNQMFFAIDCRFAPSAFNMGADRLETSDARATLSGLKRGRCGRDTRARQVSMPHSKCRDPAAGSGQERGKMSTKVFLDYDQAQLDGEMNLRGRWPEHQDYFDRWAKDSQRVRESNRCLSDLVYGDSAGQKLDLFLPVERNGSQDGGPVPLLAFVHGGYWKSLDKGDFSFLAPAYLERGIAFASLNYDLSPLADISQMVAQVRRGLAWLLKQSGAYGLDPTGLYVAGHSAGGHLAAMAMNPVWTGDFGLPPSVIKGGCSVSGVYDLEPVARSFQQVELQISADIVTSQSPIRTVPQRAAPLICAVGSDETREFIRQQKVYVEAWRQKGLTCFDVDLAGDNHFSSADRLAQVDHPLYQAVVDMISSNS